LQIEQWFPSLEELQLDAAPSEEAWWFPDAAAVEMVRSLPRLAVLRWHNHQGDEAGGAVESHLREFCLAHTAHRPTRLQCVTADHRMQCLTADPRFDARCPDEWRLLDLAHQEAEADRQKHHHDTTAATLTRKRAATATARLRSKLQAR